MTHYTKYVDNWLDWLRVNDGPAYDQLMLAPFPLSEEQMRQERQEYESTHETPYKLNWTSGMYCLQLEMTLEQAQSGSHQGQCDDDVLALSKVPEIAAQLEKLDSEKVAAELREYGAWDDEELADHYQNLQRLLWSACNDLKEEQQEVLHELTQGGPGHGWVHV